MRSLSDNLEFLKIEEITRQMVHASEKEKFDLLLMRGRIYNGFGCLSNSVSDYSSAIAINPKSDVAFFSRGRAYKNGGKIDLAINDLNIAIQLNPSNAEYYHERGNFWLRKYNYLNAERVSEKVIVLNAEKDYKKAIIIDPSIPKYYVALGRINLYYFHDWDRALDNYLTYFSMTNHSDCILFDIGIIWFFKKEYAQADYSFSACPDKKNYSLFPKVFLFSFLSKMMLGKTEEAKKEIDEVQLPERDFYPHIIFKYFQGKKSLKELWKLVLISDPYFSPQQAITETCFYVGEYFFSLGNFSKASFFLNRVKNYKDFSPDLFPYPLIAAQTINVIKA